MTEPIETTETADAVATGADTPVETEGNDDQQNPGREAAKYRTQRNEYREALASAQARIEQFQLRDLANLAGEHLAAPDDLLAVSGNQLSSYLDPETGELDIERVKADALAMISERPGLAKNPRVSAIDPSQGLGITPGKVQPSWSLLLKD